MFMTSFLRPCGKILPRLNENVQYQLDSYSTCTGDAYARVRLSPLRTRRHVLRCKAVEFTVPFSLRRAEFCHTEVKMTS